MTNSEMNQVIRRIRNLWNVEFDTEKIAVWHQILGKMSLQRLLSALNALAIEITFPPKIKEIVEMYEKIKLQEAHIARKKHIAGQKLLASADYCHICRNDGIVMYKKSNGYEYVARCACERGKDLNRWSRHQITKGMTVKNPKTGEDESLYVVNISDVLSPEEINVIQEKNKLKMTKGPSLPNLSLACPKE